MKAIVSGGGTGGHIYPALAIAGQLKAEGADILYMGAKDSLEAKLAETSGFAFFGIDACGLHKKSPRLAYDLAVNYRGLRQSYGVIKREAPELVIGTGGYAAAPVVKAAQQLGIPTLLHEQNAFPGLANRYLARRADAVCLTFAEAGSYFPHAERLHHTGLPIRRQIFDASRKAAWDYFSIPPAEQDRFTLLITGGSQGAANLNRAAQAAYVSLLRSGVRVVHLCGKANYFQLKQQIKPHANLLLLPYLDQMEHALALADLALARAGASFLSEAAVVGLPTILVPYPYAANDHQRYNAQVFAAKDAALVVEDAQLNGKLLTEMTLALKQNRPRLKRMAQAAGSLACRDATEKICAIGKGLLRA